MICLKENHDSFAHAKMYLKMILVTYGAHYCHENIYLSMSRTNSKQNSLLFRKD